VFQGALAAATRILGAKPTAAAGISESATDSPISPTATKPPPGFLAETPDDGSSGGRDSGGLPDWAWYGAGGAGGLGGLFGLRAFLRYRSRKCRACGRKMVRLDEAADDQHLDAGERKEEQLGSVDYDVWLCEACKLIIKVRYGKVFTSFKKCPKCSYKTLKSTSTVTSSPTYTSTGTRRIDEHCAQCSYANSYTTTIARLTPPSSSRSSSHSSSSSSSSSSSYRSSGGSSSGRGSSGRW
jgi:uncharacterized protein